MIKQMAIRVGFQYQNVSGKAWVVTGLRPGGVCEIQQVDRLVWGETYSRIIRDAIADGTAFQVETTDEARAILRRANGQ